MQHALCVTDKDTLLKFMIIELFLFIKLLFMYIFCIFLSRLYHGWWPGVAGCMIFLVHLMTVKWFQKKF